MDRVPYRRVTNRSKVNYEPQQKETTGITAGETVIVQCIICGILLVVVLLVSLLEFSAPFRGGINEILTGATTVQELLDDVISFTETIAITESVPEINSEIVPEIFYYTPLTADDYEPLNPQIPGPSAVLELWD